LKELALFDDAPDWRYEFLLAYLLLYHLPR
jgi:hypothetical protein